MDLATLTTFHTAISLVALLLGVPAIYTLYGLSIPRIITTLFLILAVLTTATGFLFPFNGVTPAFATGILATLVFIALFAAQYAFHFKGAFRWIYAAAMVMSVWLLAFVTIVQTFLKIPALHALAPNGSEPPFAIAQLVTLVIFIVAGIGAARKFKPV